MFVSDWLKKRSQLSPNKVALIEQKTGRKITYADWELEATRLAAFFQQGLSVDKGQRVAILSMNCVEYLDTWFACAKTGAVLQNLNWRLSREELLPLLEDAAPTVLLYSQDFLESVRWLQERYDGVQHWVALTEKAGPEDRHFSENLEYAEAALAPVKVEMSDPWVICYTGGTTGRSKGAILSHGNVFANAVNTVMSWELDSSDVAILNAPLFHVGGLNVFTSPLVYAGGTSILCDRFDVEMVFELVKNEGVSVFFGVPTMFVMMQEHPLWDKADFSHLKFVISGGAPCPMPVFEKFWDKGVHFKTGYGLTEAGPNTFWLPREQVQEHPGAVGYPLMHIEVRLVDEEGCDVEGEGVGELLIRGPHVTQGYWNNAEATSKALREGWLHTGDLAGRDEHGVYSIVGRLKDMIISGGENIYPAEIESVLHAHPKIAEACVIGIPNEKWGEVGLAAIRLLEGEQAEAAEIKAFCKERLASYKIPRRWEFLSELPKTSAGKLDKKVLRQQFGD